jgi:hypothetical protein
MGKQTVTINGVIYDAQTGMAIGGDKREVQPAISFAPASKVHPAKAIHHTTQKSQTLRRQAVKHIVTTPVVKKTTAVKPPITRSPAITKFAPHPVMTPKPAASARRVIDIAPMSHPIAAKAAARIVATKKAMAPKPSQIIKQEAIAEALAKAPTHKTRDKAATRRAKPRLMTIATASLALLLLGGYFTYLNMPNLSVRVAAAQSGINASYPGYHPDGYSIHGLVTYNDSSVNMTFAANGGPQSYTLAQTKSNLDSSAVLENYVKPKVGGSYIPYSQQGLTIYVFGNDAAWVNGGILYTINGTAPLSSDQILHIASSM